MAAERPPKEGPTSSVTDDSYHKSICPRAMAAGTVSRYKTGLRLAKHRIPYTCKGMQGRQTPPANPANVCSRAASIPSHVHGPSSGPAGYGTEVVVVWVSGRVWGVWEGGPAHVSTH